MLLEEPVEAVQFDAVSVELEVVDLAADDFDAAVVEVPDVPEVVAVVAVVPDAMQAPSTAVARRLAAPAATRERAAGRLRRDRFGMGFAWVSLMGPIIRIRGKGPAKQL